MDIAGMKREIMDLLRKLHGAPARAMTPDLPIDGSQPRRPAMPDSVHRRRRALEDLRSRRERLGQDLLEERLLGICQQLDERIARIESIIEQRAQMVERIRGGEPSRGIDPARSIVAATPDPTASHGVQESPDEPVSALSGRIRDGILTDIIQLISSNNKTGILVLENEQRRIELYMRDGELYHASTKGMDGQAAFFAAIALDAGRFFFEETDDLVEKRTIDGDTQFLILEALRQIDEDKKET